MKESDLSVFSEGLSAAGIQPEHTAIELHHSEEDNYSTSIRAEPFKAFPRRRKVDHLQSESQGPDGRMHDNSEIKDERWK